MREDNIATILEKSKKFALPSSARCLSGSGRFHKLRSSLNDISVLSKPRGGRSFSARFWGKRRRGGKSLLSLVALSPTSAWGRHDDLTLLRQNWIGRDPSRSAAFRRASVLSGWADVGLSWAGLCRPDQEHDPRAGRHAA